MNNITTTKETTMDITTSIEQFKAALNAGIEGITKAAEIYVASIDADPTNFWRFHQGCADYIPKAAWPRFEAIGRKLIHPRLIMGGIADPKKNRVVKSMPYSMQTKILSGERFEMLTRGGDTLLVDFMDATGEQVEQLFGDGRARNLSEQKAWIENHKYNKIAAAPLPYMIDGETVTFRKAVTMTRAEVARLLREMKHVKQS